MVNPLAFPSFSIGSAERIYMSAEFFISLWTEEGMINATAMAVRNLSEVIGALNAVYSPDKV